MSRTVAYPEMREFAEDWENTYRSAICSGIVGDQRHTRGYHCGRRFVPANDYSVRRPDDKGKGPADGACAVDMTMGRTDLILCTKRMAAAFHNTADPRRKYVNAYNGFDGTGPAIRYDFYARRTSTATRDHMQHAHCEKRRRYCRDRLANKAILSIMRGESVATWLRSQGITTDPGRPANAPTPARKTPKPPPYPGRVLRRNDRQRKPDPAVRQFQRQMLARGWKSMGKADGLPGAKFEACVRKWQKHCRLSVDGTVGPKTWPTPWTRPLGG